MTGCNVEPVVAPESALNAALDRYYASTGSVPTGPETLATGGSVSRPTPIGRSAGPAAPVFRHPPTRAVWWLVAVNVVIFGWSFSGAPARP